MFIRKKLSPIFLNKNTKIDVNDLYNNNDNIGQ